MERLARAALLCALAFGLGGCAGSGADYSQAPTLTGVGSPAHAGSRRPVVVPLKPRVTTRISPRAGARLLSRGRLAIVTWGSGTCPAVPDRLVVQNPHTIRIRLVVGSRRGAMLLPHKPRNAVCTGDLRATAIVITISPKQIDVHHRLTIRFSYSSGRKPVFRTASPL